MDLLELIERPNVSYETASKIAVQYLNVLLDITQTKERLIDEIKRLIEIDKYTNGLQKGILLGDPLSVYES